MSIELGFLKTQVARRLFLRFILCAVLPIAVLAGLSYVTVTANLRERGDLRLAEVATATERSVRERLGQARDDLGLIAAVLHSDPRLRNPEAPVADGPGAQLDDVAGLLSTLPRPATFASLGISTVSGESETVFGLAPHLPALDDVRREHLASGKAVLIAGTADPQDLWLGRAVDPADEASMIVWAQLDRDTLWQTSADLAVLPEAGGLCVLNAALAALHGPAVADLAFREGVQQTVESRETGYFDWASPDEGTVRSVARPIFLGEEYRSADWHVVVNVPERALMAPLRAFTFTFFPLVLLAFGTVVLFSVVQIRRTIHPLERLHEATRRLADEDLGTRVEIGSDDEFQVLASSFNSMAQNLEEQFSTLRDLQALDQVGLSATTRHEVVDTLLQTLLNVRGSDAVSVCTFGTMPGEETVSHAVVRAGPEVNIVHRFDCAPWELDSFRGTDHVVLDVESRADLPCFLRVPPFNDLDHRRFMVMPLDRSSLKAGLVCFASTNADAFSEEQIQRARHIADQAALALSNVNRREELSDLNLGALRALARTIDASSPWTAGHSERVTRIAVAIGRSLDLDDDQLDTLRRAGLLHDIGKIGVPVEILNKPSALTDEEFGRVKEHVTLGTRILEPIQAYSELLPVVLYHHERMDGNGYPEGLKGEEIPLLARIVAVADTFDALTSDRPYRKGLPFKTAVEVVRNGAQNQLDPQVVEAFMKLVEEDSVELDLLTSDPETIDFVWDDEDSYDEDSYDVDRDTPGSDAVPPTEGPEPADERRDREVAVARQDGAPRVALTL